MRAALAGAMAATLWGLQKPLDKRLFRCDYSDVAVLGKAATRGATWPLAGFGIQAVNEAMFVLASYEASTRGEPGVPRLLTNARAFGQATWRHALFGAVLGRLA
jgi:hypothetical protein